VAIRNLFNWWAVNRVARETEKLLLKAYQDYPETPREMTWYFFRLFSTISPAWGEANPLWMQRVNQRFREEG